MDPIARDLLVSLAAFAGIFGIAYLYLTTRYRERMNMIERGILPSQFNDRTSSKSLSLKFGMLAVGIAAGMLAGNVLHTAGLLNGEIAYPAMMLLFGGASLIIYYLIDNRKTN